MPGSEVVEEGSWIRREDINNPSLIENLADKLDPGEREALALAMEIQVPLLIDEAEARKEALRLGIPQFGSLRVLGEGKTRGIIPEGKPILDLQISSGMYISYPLYQSFIQLIGEA